MKKGTKKRTSPHVIARQERVYRLWLRGWSEQRIADREGVNQCQISRDLQARREQVDESASVERSARSRERAVSVYREVIAEGWEEWERSRQNKKRERTKVKQGGKGAKGGEADNSSEAEETTEGRLADPQYLNAIVRAQTRIDEIEGNDAPKEHRHSGDASNPVVVKVDVPALLKQRTYLEYLRERACREDRLAGAVRAGS